MDEKQIQELLDNASYQTVSEHLESSPSASGGSQTTGSAEESSSSETIQLAVDVPSVPQLPLSRVDKSAGTRPLSQRASVREEAFKMSPRERENVLLSPRLAQPPVQSVRNLPEMRTQGVCEALYDYQSQASSATGMQIFSFKKGDIFFLLPSSSQVWRRVRDSEGLAGYVPGDSIRIIHEDKIKELKILLSGPELQQHNTLYQKQQAKLAAEAASIASVQVEIAPRGTSTPPTSKPTKTESQTMQKMEKPSKSDSKTMKKMEKPAKSDSTKKVEKPQKADSVKPEKRVSKKASILVDAVTLSEESGSSSSSSGSSNGEKSPAPKSPKGLKKSDGGDPVGRKTSTISPPKKEKRKKRSLGCFG